MHEERYEGTHGPDEVKGGCVEIRTMFEFDSRGHERDVDIYLP